MGVLGSWGWSGSKSFASILLRLGGLGAAATLLWSSLGAPAHGAPAAAPASAAGVSLIYAGWYGNTIPTPAFIRANSAFLDSQPFHGIIAYLRDDAIRVNATSGVMGGGSMSAATLATIVAPLKGLGFAHLKDNFG